MDVKPKKYLGQHFLIDEEISERISEAISKFKKIISSKKELLKVISSELNNIKEKFAVPRRTKIIDAVLNYDIEETIQKETVLITVTLQGYIKRGSLKTVKIQKRGGKGKTGITTRNEDSVVQTLSVNTHTSVLFFSTEGLVYRIKAWKIPEGSASSKGKSLFNILPLKNHQSISSIMPYPEKDEDSSKYQIVFATSKGKVRKNQSEAAEQERRGRPVPEALAKTLNDLRREVSATESDLERRNAELFEVEEAYERDKARFSQLQENVKRRRAFHSENN